MIYQEVRHYCQQLEHEFELINSKRQLELTQLTNYLLLKYRDATTPQAVVICTHNSRRSHIGQIWLAVAADYYQLPHIQSYSGGTEATAFNPRAVAAMRRVGFDVVAEDDTSNPRYQVSWSANREPLTTWSKVYSDEANPTEDFVAIMVCTSADQACPIVSGCDARISLPYEDPKDYDDTPQEAQMYHERVRQIGREMMYVMHQVKQELQIE